MELEGFEFIVVLWPYASAAIIAPMTAWIKVKIPADIPIGTELISGALAIGMIMLMSWLFELGLSFKDATYWVLVADKTASVGHSLWKTVKKNSPFGSDG